jgi:hypothetical protein
MDKDKNNRQKQTEILIFLVAVLAIVLLWYFYFFNKPSSKNNGNNQVNTNNEAVVTEKILPTSITPSTLAPTLTPVPLLHGKQGFVVSVGRGSLGPKLGRGFIDPMDPQIGEKQTFTIEVNDQTQVKKVVASLVTDNKTSPEYELKQIDGTPNKKGNWQGSWTIDDSYLHKYLINLKAFGDKDVSSITITLRQ